MKHAYVVVNDQPPPMAAIHVAFIRMAVAILQDDVNENIGALITALNDDHAEECQ